MVLDFLKSFFGSESSTTKVEKGSVETSVEEGVEQAADVVRCLGFENEDVKKSYENYLGTDLEEGRPMESYMIENDVLIHDLGPEDSVPVAGIVRNIIRYSDNGFHTDFSYTERDVQRKLTNALPGDFALRLETLDGVKLDSREEGVEYHYVEEGDPFCVVLNVNESESRSEKFSYPEDHYGKSSLDRLVECINTELLDDESFSIYRLKRFGDYWLFSVLEDRNAENFRQCYGSDAQVAGETLIEFS